MLNERNFGSQEINKNISYLNDLEEESYYPLLAKLPRELASVHARHIIENELDETESEAYLISIHELRREAQTETHFSDTNIENLSEEIKKQILNLIENDTYNRHDNLIGKGTTAAIKSMTIKTSQGELPLAIKYLLTPTEKTLSASAEHEMLIEVERIKKIEEIESNEGLNFIGVPHPYLDHKNSRVECYAMQLIDGFDLDVFNEHIEEINPELLEKIANIDELTVNTEIDRFFNKMHEYCLHGDMKPKNLMFDQSSKFYVIDFGQSVLTNSINESELDSFENLKENEIESTKLIIKMAKKKALERLKEINS